MGGGDQVGRALDADARWLLDRQDGFYGCAVAGVDDLQRVGIDPADEQHDREGQAGIRG